MSVSRFGVSLETDILESLDEFVIENNFANRSRAIRHLIEKNLVEKKWKCDNIVAGVITLVYQASSQDILLKTSEIHQQNSSFILSTQRIQLNDVNCMEIFVIQGASRKLTELSEKLISIKGIQHGKLVMSKAL